MEPTVFLAVLLAAALHAGWNALVKVGLDELLSVALISLGAGAISLVALPFVMIPKPAAWPWLLVSVVFHTGYNMFLSRAYRVGDLGQVYPIARGTAPLIVIVVMTVGFGEVLEPAAVAGIALLVVGVGLMSVRGGRNLAQLRTPAVLYALGTAFFIASYTVTDGHGVRANTSAPSYALWLFFLDGLVMLAILLAIRGKQSLRTLRTKWRVGLAGGSMSLGAYWIALWAMSVAPIALVAALRETSVLFAAVISILVLREPLTKWRSIAAVMIVAGIIVTRAH